MTKKLSNAVLVVLAYTHITGNFPKGIQAPTWSQAFDLVETNPAYHTGPDRRYYLLKAEALSLIAMHPYKLAHDYLTGLGFKAPSYATRNTSHYVSYTHPDTADAATAFRDGGVSLRPWVDKPPYKTIQVSHDEIVAALAERAAA